MSDIKTILESLNFSDIKIQNDREIRCSREKGGNSTSVRVNINTLSYTCFSTNEYGNIYTAVMSRLHYNFPQALSWVADVLGLEKASFNKKTKLPFGGFYKKLIRESADPELYMKKYDTSILEQYKNSYNLMFFNDGISFQTQKDFNIGYDISTNRITVPQYDVGGNLVGIMGRENDLNGKKEDRWLPIIPCSRSLTLYGYHKNYQNIQKNQMCLIFESEKSIMQLHTQGYNIGLATCKNSISPTQQKYIKALMIPNIIIAYDEGVDEYQLINMAEKLKVDNQIYKNNVGYIYDKENEILKKGSKASPSDLGPEVLTRLVNEKIRWVV